VQSNAPAQQSISLHQPSRTKLCSLLFQFLAIRFLFDAFGFTSFSAQTPLFLQTQGDETKKYHKDRYEDNLLRLGLGRNPPSFFLFAPLAFLFPSTFLKYAAVKKRMELPCALNATRDFCSKHHLFLLLSRFFYCYFLNAAAKVN
jgi:hypothetical protein